MPQVTFRALAEADFPDLHGWLNRPHLRQFFQKKPISAADVAEKYRPRIRGQEPTHCHLAVLESWPFGYLQCYRIADYPIWAEMTGEKTGIGVDLAIFDPERIGRGLGRPMLGAYLRDIAFPLHPEESRCFIAHETENIAGSRNSLSVGFKPVRDFVEDGQATRLLMLNRAEMAGLRG